jgi:hypothetical protein
MELMTKYPTVVERENRMAQLDSEIGVIQDRRDKLMKSMKGTEIAITSSNKKKLSPDRYRREYRITRRVFLACLSECDDRK